MKLLIIDGDQGIVRGLVQSLRRQNVKTVVHTFTLKEARAELARGGVTHILSDTKVGDEDVAAFHQEHRNLLTDVRYAIITREADPQQHAYFRDLGVMIFNKSDLNVTEIIRVLGLNT